MRSKLDYWIGYFHTMMGEQEEALLSCEDQSELLDILLRLKGLED